MARRRVTTVQYMDDGTDAPGTVPTTATEQEEEAQQGGDRELAATPFEALLAEVDDGPAAAPAAAPAAQPQPPGSSADGPLDNALVPSVVEKKRRLSLNKIENAGGTVHVMNRSRMRAHSLARGGANAVLIKGWEEIDTDGDDFMTKQTFVEVSAHLGMSWDIEEAWKRALAIDKERSKREKSTDNTNQGLHRVQKGIDQVHFTSYTSVFNVIMGAERRNHRLVVKLGFEKLQRGPTGMADGLTKPQVEALVSKVSRMLLLLQPAFDIDRDWKLMWQGHTKKVVPGAVASPQRYRRGSVEQLKSSSRRLQPADDYAVDPESATDPEAATPHPDEEECVVQELVNWTEFEDWWKLRMGLTETNVPVIPEYFSYKLKELSDTAYMKTERAGALRSTRSVRYTAEETGSYHRGAKNLWWELQRRIRLMVKMRQDWGQLGSTYGHSDSIYGRIPVIGCVIDPDSAFSAHWDMLQVIFLFYVTIFVPLRSCFMFDAEIYSAMWVVDTIVDLYFILDLFLNCITAFDDFGIRETRHKQIILHYLKTWFVFDLLACLPVQYIAMAIENQDTDKGSNLNIVKAIRLIRLSKMLRLTRIKRILAKYEDLMLVQQYQGVAVLAFAILFASHFLACFWYLIGTSKQDKSYNTYKSANGFETLPGDLVIEGWVSQEWGNVTNYPLDLADIPLGARYSSSMYYVFNALEVRKRISLPFDTNNHHLTKTGSRQT